jgi:signal transduction histidine kinase
LPSRQSRRSIPLVFATLPLPAALVVTTVVNITPLTFALLFPGPGWPNLPLAVAVTLIGAIAAPIIGTVIMTSMRQREKLAAFVAELAATRAESARLSREAGAAAERERLAREIHDTLAQGFTSIVALAQGFTSIVALAQAVEPELDSDTAAAKRHVELIRSTARENLAEARAMVAELTPTALHDGSLPAAIQRQCDKLSAESRITATVRVDGELPPLGMATDVVLLRAAQEAFTNIRKHSEASTVTVALSPMERGVRLSVADNGIGPTDEYTEGFGLRGMRARTTQVGGTMSATPTPGGGTTVTVEVPA